MPINTPKEYTLADFALVNFDTPDKVDSRKLIPNPKKTPRKIVEMNPSVFVVYRGQYYMRIDVPSEPITKNAIGVEIRKLNRAFEASKPVEATGVLLKSGNIAGYHPDGTQMLWQQQDED